jgi:hypothetical protein
LIAFLSRCKLRAAKETPKENPKTNQGQDHATRQPHLLKSFHHKPPSDPEPLFAFFDLCLLPSALSPLLLPSSFFLAFCLLPSDLCPLTSAL